MSTASLVFAQRTDTGLKRQSNEDSVISILPEDQQVMANKGALFVVADGMGGHTRGDVASQLAVNTLRDAYYQDESGSLRTSLRLAMEQANTRIYEKNAAEPPRAKPEKPMATTCIAAVVRGDTLYVANVRTSPLSACYVLIIPFLGPRVSTKRSENYFFTCSVSLEC
jgi:serine/threonine protein phosphatase PrpC